MARALSVHHGPFGRAKLYALDKALITHAHREGHLLFYLGGTEGRVVVDGTVHRLGPDTAVAISSWEPHSFGLAEAEQASHVLTLYIRPAWFLDRCGMTGTVLHFGRAVLPLDAGLKKQIGALSDRLCAAGAETDLEDALFALVQRCHRRSWQGASPSDCAAESRRIPSDFRVRRSLKVMQERYREDTSMDALAREAGLSRPHFFKLFKSQMGITPNLYLNTLKAEHAIEALVTTDRPVTEIGRELGFASQASFTRFFTTNVGVPPSDYRRAGHDA